MRPLLVTFDLAAHPNLFPTDFVVGGGGGGVGVNLRHMPRKIDRTALSTESAITRTPSSTNPVVRSLFCIMEKCNI